MHQSIPLVVLFAKKKKKEKMANSPDWGQLISGSNALG